MEKFEIPDEVQDWSQCCVCRPTDKQGHYCAEHMKNQDSSPAWYTPEFLAVLKKQMHMSDETWGKVIAADPTGWREMLGDETNG